MTSVVLSSGNGDSVHKLCMHDMDKTFYIVKKNVSKVSDAMAKVVATVLRCSGRESEREREESGSSRPKNRTQNVKQSVKKRKGFEEVC